MNKVYKHKALAPDQYLGHVDADGRVFESRFGPDRYIGRVDPRSGKIYEARLGPDRHIGQVYPENGKVYLAKFGPDEYIGRVHQDGKLYLHKPLASDEYLGKVVQMSSRVHGGGAFLLLVIPDYDEQAAAETEETLDSDLGSEDTGPAPAPA